MIALCDLDGVLNNFADVCINKFNEDNGTHFTIDDVYTYDIATSFGVTDFQYFLDNYLLSADIVNNCIPMKESVEYLEKVNNTWDLRIVTAREWGQLTNIFEWFQEHFNYIKDRQIIRSQDKSIVRGDVLIDDSLDNILAFPAGRILFDYRFNRDVDDLQHFINRVKSWEDCYNVLELMRGKGVVKKI